MTQVFGLSYAASAIALLALPLSAILMFHLAENVREESGSETGARTLEALSVIAAGGMSWFSCLFLPLAILCLAAVLMRSRVVGSTWIDRGALSVLVYGWSSFAVLWLLIS